MELENKDILERSVSEKMCSSGSNGVGEICSPGTADTCGIGGTDDTLWWTGVSRGFSVYKCVFLSLQNAIWTDDMGKRKTEKDSGRKNPAVFLFLWNEKEN